MYIGDQEISGKWEKSIRWNISFCLWLKNESQMVIFRSEFSLSSLEMIWHGTLVIVIAVFF
jgi:hypothetical protein